VIATSGTPSRQYHTNNNFDTILYCEQFFGLFNDKISLEILDNIDQASEEYCKRILEQ
jgi:hypothetical protein